MPHRRFKCRVLIFSGHRRNPLSTIKWSTSFFLLVILDQQQRRLSSRDCNRALQLSVFAFATVLCVRLQSGNINSHEKEKGKKKLEVSISFTRYLILSACAISCRYSSPTSSLSILSGISSCHRSEIILSLRVWSTLTGT